ncbi:MAG: hypothetical protein DRI84_00520 [Bacteroidetes bacterium]|nr:MAG: hypothetical protein DRI84_00520 [Bacteroidota bacterium]
MKVMKIIADSGSTKTHWVVISEGKQSKSFFSEGLNPYFLDSNEISLLVANCFLGLNVEDVEEIHFYGAGCSLPEKCNIVQSALKSVFPNSQIEIFSDLLAAAHALFGKTHGVACILGTGSNAAVYDGYRFVHKIQSLGYILGDEGSGAYIGRQFLKMFLNKEMPNDLRIDFAKKYHMDIPDILENIYKKPFPNRYLASFASFASEHSEDRFINSVIRNAFSLFIKYQLNTLEFDKKMPVGFVGSIAFHFQSILKDELQYQGYTIGNVLKEPISELTQYHS